MTPRTPITGEEVGPWIKWSGGKCPVDKKTGVRVRLHHETRSTAETYPARPAGYWDWSKVRGGAAIAEYRVIPAATAARQQGEGK